jgi:DNA-binding NtrC family response regulator
VSRIFLIDDEAGFRQMLARLLVAEGYDVAQAPDARNALAQLPGHEWDLILCDVRLPDANGVELTPKLRALCPETPVIVFTAHGTIQDGVQSIRNGAYDYLVKGTDNDRMLPAIERAIEQRSLRKRVASLEKKLGDSLPFEALHSDAPPMQQALALARRVAPTDATVLLTGETGTGKEVFARAIHAASARAGKPLVSLNCASFSKELLESELFGHKAGAFTGALRDKKGLIEEANGGTLFLDEIGEMPMEVQPRLLRVLESGEYYKVGDTRPLRAQVRLIAATNRDLLAACDAGTFRPDLYYRLSTFQVAIPPLRERVADLPALATAFVARFGRAGLRLSPETLRLLQAYPWRGNVRELRNVMERACILAEGDTLTPDCLPYEMLHFAENTPGKDDLSLQTAEMAHIRKVLALTGGNKTKTAALLGIGLTTLYAKLKEG